jgi:hypothetical protein
MFILHSGDKARLISETIKRNPMITVLITTVVILGIFTLYKTLKA